MLPWDSIELRQFNLVPKIAAPMLQKVADGWGTFRIIPVESGRGCPYGCEFCTVAGFFGDSIRFRTNESVVSELPLLKATGTICDRVGEDWSNVTSSGAVNPPSDCPRTTAQFKLVPRKRIDPSLRQERKLPIAFKRKRPPHFRWEPG